MHNLARSAVSSLWLVSILPLACAGAEQQAAPTEAPPPNEVEPPKPSQGRFLLTLSTDKLPIAQGGTEELEVSVERKNGFEGAVLVTAGHLPEGVTAEAITIASDETKGVLKLEAQAKAPHSLPTSVQINGKAAKLSDARELTVTVYGAPGSVDTSFQGGKVMVPVGGADAYAYALAAQPDGKLLVAGTSHDHGGDFALLRLDRDGQLDESFGSAGLVSTEVGAGSDIARAVAVDDEGRIVLAGSADSGGKPNFGVVRYLPNGKLDDHFGDHGKVVVKVGDDADTAYALVLQADGKIVVGGDSNQGSSKTGVDFALARLLPDGSLDESFGDSGIVTQSVAQFGARDSIYALALQPVDGEQRIVAVGGEGDFSLARFRADGELDTSFGEQGTLHGLFGSTIGAARAVVVTDAGELLVAGHAMHDFALTKLSPEGELVASFGDAGKVVTAVSKDNWDEANGLAVETDGKLLVAGFTYEGHSSSGNTALVRYDDDGALDASFGDAGVVITEVAAPSKPDQGSALVLSPDERVPSERILVAGFASSGFSQFAITRFWR
jgi:uncharacterized delta-60 repeat protein